MTNPSPLSLKQAEPKRTNRAAVASLILGILGIIPFGPLAGIPAVICGHIASRSIRKSHLKGKGMAVAGLVLGYGSLALFCLVAVGIWNVARDITAPGGLHEAAKSGDISRAEVMLNSGADINEKKPFGTPLHFAAGFGQPEMVKYLLSKGADIDSWVEVGGTPLISAASAKRTECVQILLKHGANVNATGSTTLNETALHLAALNGHTEVMRVLIVAGADINARDFAGRTPLDTAKLFKGQDEAATLLREFGAR